MKSWIAGLALCLLASLMAHPALSAEPYRQTRARLIKQGYLPLVFQQRSSGAWCDYDYMCEAYPEVDSCSGTGKAYCAFFYFRPSDKTYWRVITAGEVGRYFEGIYKSNARAVAETGKAVVAKTPVTPVGHIKSDLEFEERYRPLSLKQPADFCWEDYCRRHKETLSCSMQRPFVCEFAYRSYADRQYYVITTEGMGRWNVTGFGKANARQLAEIKRRL